VREKEKSFFLIFFTNFKVCNTWREGYMKKKNSCD
jgi:hypothetical protein